MESTKTFAVLNTWLDNQSGHLNALTQQAQSNGDYLDINYSYWPYPYYPVVSSPARPIKLTLAEVDRLRKAAKSDEKLKEILVKFTPQIEVIVDLT